MRPIPRGWLHCEIWRREDLSRTEGAQLAREIAEHLLRFSTQYAGLLFDLRRATPIWGPATDEAIARMFAPWEARRKAVWVVPAHEAIQQIALRKLLTASAPMYGRLLEDFEGAMAELEAVHSTGPSSAGARSAGSSSQRSPSVFPPSSKRIPSVFPPPNQRFRGSG